eukprot:3091296-Rhodomonas_salina.2
MSPSAAILVHVTSHQRHVTSCSTRARDLSSATPFSLPLPPPLLPLTSPPHYHVTTPHKSVGRTPYVP